MTKNEFYNAVLEIHKEKSLDKITIRDICSYLDISKGTIYYHFKNREDLFKQMFIEFKTASTKSIYDCNGDLKDKIYTFIKYNKENNEHYRFIFNSEISDFIDEDISKEIENQKSELLRCFEINPDKEKHISIMIYGTLSTYLCGDLLLSPTEEDKLIDTLVDIIKNK